MATSSSPGLGLLDDEDITKIIERRTGESGLLITTWRLVPNLKVEGFMGSYYTLNVIVNRNNVFKKFIFFAKTAPKSGIQREMVKVANVFNCELAMYEKIIPLMGLKSGPKWSPNCYLTKHNVILVLEDLTLQNYVCLDKYTPFGFEELICLFNTFASFHSRSLIFDEQLRLQGKTLWDIWGDTMHEKVLFNYHIASISFQVANIHGFMTVIDMLDNLGSDMVKDKLRKKILKWTWNLCESFQPSKKYRNIICHRDVWSANFMFKFDNQGKPENCCLIDFQFYCYCYPAMDLMLAMYMNSSRKIRDEHFYGLIELYYNRLRELLKEESLDVDCILPWDNFLESCKDARYMAMIYTANQQQLTLLEPKLQNKYLSKSPDLLEHVMYGTGRPEIVRLHFEKVPAYRERLIENILEIHECLPDELPDK